ncbi:MAG: hypothetical protein LAT54_04800 [Cryomorphaceae bacterium]|nr:hypothetical protein [Cryomorphaceae bacterium]
MGTNAPAKKEDAPAADSNQGKINPGLASCSANLLHTPLSALRTKPVGTSSHASSGILAQLRSSPLSSVTKV